MGLAATRQASAPAVTYVGWHLARAGVGLGLGSGLGLGLGSGLGSRLGLGLGLWLEVRG